jgi:putative DNA methylase
MTNKMPKVLIEDWLPIEAIGAESQRERGASSALPPTYYLHVWWARRPLIASRAAVVLSLLPEWTNEWPSNLLEKFPQKTDYQAWVLGVLGILGDPASARARIEFEKNAGIRTSGDKYGYPRAYSHNPSREEIEILHELFQFTWGNTYPSVLDAFAGGGSIPFESLRYGFTTIANDLNPVAAIVLKTTLEYPTSFGTAFAENITKWGNRWNSLAKAKLAPFFAAPPNEPKRSIYIWARTISCPMTGKPVPLSPNWWISKRKEPIAVRLLTHATWNQPKFQVVKGNEIDFDPDIGTVSRGVGRSPWTGEIIEGDYIKREAQNGRMGQMLYCIEVETGSGRDYIAPEESDAEMFLQAEKELMGKKAEWISKGLYPIEQIPEGNKTSEPRRYGMYEWADIFSPRQLLSQITFIETLQEIENEIRQSSERDQTNAIITYLALALNKCANYNSRLSVWHALRATMANTFNRHDFAFAWSHGEYNSTGNLMPWAIHQTAKAYKEIAEIAFPAQQSFLRADLSDPLSRLSILRGTASNISELESGSVHNITIDPPYYDNVQYAELSDFFYIWLKRSVGHLFPEFFTDELTNKDDEAVANPVRFESMGRKKKALAEQDYERKMASAFREMYRILNPHGVLTVMFTHKRVEAWDTLASALIGAGFTIKASWPVHTESEHSLHQAKKNAAASTILLVCRKREHDEAEPVWWDDLQSQVRRVAREKAQEYVQQGISGVDLYISTFGPTLSVISEQWPVLTSEVNPKTGEPLPLRPETALDLAREEVVRLRKEGLLAGKAIEFDPVTDWYLMAWDAFAAEEFPYDEARKLAIALGLEMDDLLGNKKLVAKKGQYVVIQQPQQRRKKGMVDSDAAHFEHLIDALHTAMLIYEEDGAGACDVFLQNRNLKRDSTFRAGLQTLINAIPRTKVKHKFVRPEADVLDRMRLAFYADELTVPPEEEPPLPQVEQLGFSFDAETYDEEDQDDET